MIKWVKIIMFACICMYVVTLYPMTACASEFGIVDNGEFENLSGDAKYIGKDYRDNYYFDIEKTGIMDKMEVMINGMANAIFTIIKALAYLTVSVFYFSMDFNLSEKLSPMIADIQRALNNGIFQPLFIFVIALTFFSVAFKLFRRDLMGVGGELFKVIFVTVCSMAVIVNSSNVLSVAANVTKSVSVRIINSFNSDYGIENGVSGYAAQAAGALWVNLVHEPWKTLEFGEEVDDNVIEAFLGAENEEERANLVANFENGEEVFSKNKGFSRLGFCLAYFIPFLVKCVLYIGVAVVQIGFQCLAMLLMFLASLVLLLALVPGYGMDIINIWLRKMLETQLSILIISFVLALMVKLDEVLYGYSTVFGWFPVIIFQIAVGAMLFLYRYQLIYMFGNVQRTMSNPRYFKKMVDYGMRNPYNMYLPPGIATGRGGMYMPGYTVGRRYGGRMGRPFPRIRKSRINMRPSTSNAVKNDRSDRSPQIKNVTISGNTPRTIRKTEPMQQNRPITTRKIDISTSKKLSGKSDGVSEIRRPISTGSVAPLQTREPVKVVHPTNTSLTKPLRTREPAEAVHPTSTGPMEPLRTREPAETARPISTGPVEPSRTREPAEAARPISTGPVEPLRTREPAEVARPISTGPVEPSRTREPAEAARPVSTGPVEPSRTREPAEVARPVSTGPVEPSRTREPAESTRPVSMGPVEPLSTREPAEVARPISTGPVEPLRAREPAEVVQPTNSNVGKSERLQEPPEATQPVVSSVAQPARTKGKKRKTKPVSRKTKPEK